MLSYGLSLSSLSRGTGNIETSEEEPGYQKIVVKSDAVDPHRRGRRFPSYARKGAAQAGTSSSNIPKTYVTRKGALIIYANTIVKNPEPPKRDISIFFDKMDRGDQETASGSNHEDETEDMISLGSLTRNILSYGSSDHTKLCLTVPKGERKMIPKERRVRAGFSAKRYLASLVDHVDGQVTQSLIDKGCIRSIYQDSVLLSNVKRRVNADISGEPEPYMVMRYLMNIPGSELSNFLFVAEKSTVESEQLAGLRGKRIRASNDDDARPKKSVFSGADAEELRVPAPTLDPKESESEESGQNQAPIQEEGEEDEELAGNKIRVFETMQEPDGSQRTVPIEYRQLERDKKVQVLTNLLVKTAITYAVSKKEKREAELTVKQSSGRALRPIKEETDVLTSFGVPLPLPDPSAMFFKAVSLRSVPRNVRPVPDGRTSQRRPMERMDMTEALQSLLQQDEMRVVGFGRLNGTEGIENTPVSSRMSAYRDYQHDLLHQLEADSFQTSPRRGNVSSRDEYEELEVAVDNGSDSDSMLGAGAGGDDESPPPQPFSVTVSTREPPSGATSGAASRLDLRIVPAHALSDARAQQTKSTRTVLYPRAQAVSNDVALSVPGMSIALPSSAHLSPSQGARSARGTQEGATLKASVAAPAKQPVPHLFGSLIKSPLGRRAAKSSTRASDLAAKGNAAFTPSVMSLTASEALSPLQVPPLSSAQAQTTANQATDSMEEALVDEPALPPDILNLNPEEYALYLRLIEQAKKVASVILQEDGAGVDLAIDSEAAMQAILQREKERSAQEEENEEKRRLLKETICDIVSTKTGSELNPDEVNISDRVMERLLTDPEMKASDLQLVFDGRSSSIIITTEDEAAQQATLPEEPFETVQADEGAEHSDSDSDKLLPPVDASPVVNLVSMPVAEDGSSRASSRATKRSGRMSAASGAGHVSPVKQLDAVDDTPPSAHKSAVQLEDPGWVAVQMVPGITAIVPQEPPEVHVQTSVRERTPVPVLAPSPAIELPKVDENAANVKSARQSASVSIAASPSRDRDTQSVSQTPSKAEKAEKPDDLLDKLIKEQQASGKPTPQKRTGQAPTTKSEVIRRKSPPPPVPKKKESPSKPPPLPKPRQKSPVGKKKKPVVAKKQAEPAAAASVPISASPAKQAPSAPETIPEETLEVDKTREPSPDFVRVTEDEEGSVSEDNPAAARRASRGYSIDDIRRTLGRAPAVPAPIDDSDNETDIPSNAIDREARAARRKLEAEQRRLLMEQRRKEKEEAKRREDEERERQARMQRDLMDEQQRRIEELRAQREALEEERRRKEREEEEAELAKKRKEEHERLQREAYQRKMEEMQRKLLEEEERKLREEEERRREEEIRKLEEERRKRMMSETQRREYERMLAEEEEKRRLEEERARLEREEAMRKSIEEARRLAFELARKEMERQQHEAYIRMNVIEREGLAQHTHKISRAFVTSYFELLQWLEDL